MLLLLEITLMHKLMQWLANKLALTTLLREKLQQ